jgi:hypothetical protein
MCPIIRSRIGLSNLMDEKTGQTMIITTIETIDGNSDSRRPSQYCIFSTQQHFVICYLLFIII